jgi:hypothetical protein
VVASSGTRVSVGYYVSYVHFWQARGLCVHKTTPAASGRGEAKGRVQRPSTPALKWRARGRIEHTLLDGGFSVHPNRPKTFARYHTIPQKVTNVSIHTKGPEPSRLESSDPMIEASEPSTEDVSGMRYVACARPTGGSYRRTTRGPAQRRGAQSEGRARHDGEKPARPGGAL